MSNTISSKTQKNGTRFYTSPKTQHKYPSVTTILGKYEDKRWLKQWRENVGDEHIAITRGASSLGTRVHSCCENYMNSNKSESEVAKLNFSKYATNEKITSDTLEEIKARFYAYKPFLDLMQPISIEEKLIWESYSAAGDPFGWGGTADNIGLLPTSSFEFFKPVKDEEIPAAFTQDKPLIFIADYKNNRSYKSSKDFVKAYCQLSAYAAAKNLELAPENYIQHGFILSSSCSEKRKKSKLSIFYIDLERLDFYFGWFYRFVEYYFGIRQEPKDIKPWSTFKELACGYKFDGKDEDGKNIWVSRERDYLGQKLELIV
jgi:hypothetical protein